MKLRHSFTDILDKASDIIALIAGSYVREQREDLPVLGVAATVLDFDEHFSGTGFGHWSILDVDFGAWADYGALHGCDDG